MRSKGRTQELEALLAQVVFFYAKGQKHKLHQP